MCRDITFEMYRRVDRFGLFDLAAGPTKLSLSKPDVFHSAIYSARVCVRISVCVCVCVFVHATNQLKRTLEQK